MHTNRLIHETSPYLQQHAHNPVDWYPWGEEALQKAKEEDKPILVSIGYAACHWCHVMERESFEHEETAAIMNGHFINIKIDREERPDLDHIYMDAVQAMTGSGGWPLNVFLTPDAKPFYGGTYFPPQRAFNRPSWTEVLQGVAVAYRDKKADIMGQADSLVDHMIQAASYGINNNDNEQSFAENTLHTVFSNLMKMADKADGGFGRAPKFPQSFSIQYLLRYYHFFKHEDALAQACLSLDKMIYGGIYDQLGGGFARYSTDNEWLVPHFEKMLYDNALLVSVLSEAYQVTHRVHYLQAIHHTMDFVKREMLSPENGFYSALDADSEGEEGKFYIWQKNEIEEVLGSDAEWFCTYFGISENGNWEGKNILHVAVPPAVFAAENEMDAEAFQARLQEAGNKLLAYRSKRVGPGLDDKILLGWNALMNTACSKAYVATGKEEYRRLAVTNMEFLLGRFGGHNNFFYHTWKNNIARHPAFLDDYAYLIQSLIHLQEITGNGQYLTIARTLIHQVLDNFGDTASDFFFFTHKDQGDVILRKKELYDGAVPSGNALMAGNLHYLSFVFDESGWRKRAGSMIGSLAGAVSRYPGSFGVWANELLLMTKGMKEIIVTGDKNHEVHFEILHNFIPDKILQLSSVPDNTFPLLIGKQFSAEYPLIYLCKNYVCNTPVRSVDLLVQQLEN